MNPTTPSAASFTPNAQPPPPLAIAIQQQQQPQQVQLVYAAVPPPQPTFITVPFGGYSYPPVPQPQQDVKPVYMIQAQPEQMKTEPIFILPNSPARNHVLISHTPRTIPPPPPPDFIQPLNAPTVHTPSPEDSDDYKSPPVSNGEQHHHHSHHARHENKDNRRKRKRSASLSELKFCNNLTKTGPYSRIRVWVNDRNMVFYDCHCGKRKPLQDLGKIKRHAEGHEKNEYICPICDRTFEHHLQLNAHKKAHKPDQNASSSTTSASTQMLQHHQYSNQYMTSDGVHIVSANGQFSLSDTSFGTSSSETDPASRGHSVPHSVQPMYIQQTAPVTMTPYPVDQKPIQYQVVPLQVPIVQVPPPPQVAGGPQIVIAPAPMEHIIHGPQTAVIANPNQYAAFSQNPL